MNVHEFLNTYLGGNKNVSTLTYDALAEMLTDYAKTLQLQQTGVSGSTFIAISKETGKGYFFEYSDMYLWENDDSVDIYEVKYYR